MGISYKGWLVWNQTLRLLVAVSGFVGNTKEIGIWYVSVTKISTSSLKSYYTSL